MAKKDKNADPFGPLCDRVDRLSRVYGGDKYWQIMKEGCDAVRNESVTDELIEKVKKEHKCWGPAMSNKQALTLLLEKMKN